MTDDELKAIEERAATATPGPLQVREDQDHCGDCATYLGIEPFHYGPRGEVVEGPPPSGSSASLYFWRDVLRIESKNAADEPFLINAQADVVKLAAEVRRLQSDLRTATDDAETLSERVKELDDGIHDPDTRKRLGLALLD